jgi:hypothetical protein
MKLVQLLTVTDATALEHLSKPQLTELQSALRELGFPIDAVDGLFGPNTQAAWAAYKATISSSEPDLIGPASIQSLQRSLDAPHPELELSGLVWVDRFPRSTLLDDLRPSFRSGATRMVGSLRAGGADVEITSTLRPAQRAYLMHFSKAIHEGMSPAAVPKRFDVPIQWVHPKKSDSVAAATAMFNAYGIRGPVALNSNHIVGHAIDMFITFSGSPTIRDGSGKAVRLTGPNDPDNASVVRLGRTFGVIRGSGISGDPEHWSINGT